MGLKTLLLVAVIFSNSPALVAADTGELEASLEKFLESVNSRDLDSFRKAWHHEAVLFFRNQLFPVDLKEIGMEAWSKLFGDIFAGYVDLDYTAVDLNYRILGEIGLVWGLTELTFQLKGEAPYQQGARLTATFARTKGGWKIVSWHDSAFPERLRAGK